MPATHSTEAQIQNGLDSLNCPDDNFLRIAQQLGVSVSKGYYSDSMLGRRPLDRDVAEKLLSVLRRMQLLQASVDIPINWRMTVPVSDAIVAREIAGICATELHMPDADLETAASGLTDRLTRTAK